MPITEDPILDWGLRPPRRTSRRTLVVIIAMVGVLAGAIGLWLILRPDPTPPVRAPATSSVVLPPPAGYDGAAGYPIGFPRTELGAASAAAAALESVWTLEVDQAEQAAVLYAAPEQREAARDGARATVRGWRDTLDLSKEGELPAGAAMRTQTVGIQWRPGASDQVHVSVLVQVTATKGTKSNEPLYSSLYAMSLLMAWSPDIRGKGHGDWVNIPDPAPPAVPQAAPPGTPEFTAAGWKPLIAPTP